MSSRSSMSAATFVASCAGTPSHTTCAHRRCRRCGCGSSPRRLEMGDAAFGTGAPLDQFHEALGALELGRSAFARPFRGMTTLLTPRSRALSPRWPRHSRVGGHSLRDAAEQLDDALDGRREQRASEGLPIMTSWSSINAIGVVEYLGLVAEFDRTAEPPLSDGPGVGVVQRHHPFRSIGHRPESRIWSGRSPARGRRPSLRGRRRGPWLAPMPRSLARRRERRALCRTTRASFDRGPRRWRPARR